MFKLVLKRAKLTVISSVVDVLEIQLLQKSKLTLLYNMNQTKNVEILDREQIY